MTAYPIVLHIPHASTFIPNWTRDQFVLTDADLQREIARMTDWHTDRLYALPSHVDAERVIALVSRLVTDVERLPIDDTEPMAELGMGMFYRLTADGLPLRRELVAEEVERLFETYYRPHHRRLSDAVDRALHRFGACCIIDCHSFPCEPLLYEDARLHRPELCIGVEASHTSKALEELVLAVAKRYFGDVAINTPFSGALVSLDHWCEDMRVSAFMLEVRRDLYLRDGGLNLVFMAKMHEFMGVLTKAVTQHLMQVD